MGHGPPEAMFTELYRANYGRVLRFIARRVDDDRAAEDLTAEVFQIAWSRAALGTPLSPAWLFVTAKNTLSNHRRSVQRGERAFRRLAADSAGQQADTATAELVVEALAALPEAQRDILVHRYWDGLGAREIGTITNASVSAVWVRLHRARQAFTESFKAVSEAGHANR